MFARHTVNTPYAVGPVHLYVFERGGGVILFDTGPPTNEGFEYIKKNIPLDRVKYVFVTHSHADHCGGLKFISENSNAKIVLSKKDILKEKMFGKIVKLLGKTFLSLGFPQGVMSFMIKPLLYFKEETKLPANIKPLEDIVLPKGIEFFPFPGHSITDIVYFVDKQYAITGDFLLSDIFQTPLIEIDPQTMQVFNNYKAYCASISNIGLLEGLEILPSHSKVDSVKDVVSFYVEKILKRSEFAIQCLKQNCSIFDAVCQLSNPYEDPFKAYVKASELVFFESFAKNPQLLENSLEKIGLIDRFKNSFK